jgi:hypothetical protein
MSIEGLGIKGLKEFDARIRGRNEFSLVSPLFLKA